MTVFDSWAVIRFLEDPAPAAGEVGKLLDRERPIMSRINVGRGRRRLRRLHGEDQAAETVRDLRDAVELEIPTAELVLSAARIKAQHPLAYADAFAAATAVAQDAELWTGDPGLLRPGSPWRWRDLRPGAV